MMNEEWQWGEEEKKSIVNKWSCQAKSCQNRKEKLKRKTSIKWINNITTYPSARHMHNRMKFYAWYIIIENYVNWENLYNDKLVVMIMKWKFESPSMQNFTSFITVYVFFQSDRFSFASFVCRFWRFLIVMIVFTNNCSLYDWWVNSFSQRKMKKKVEKSTAAFTVKEIATNKERTFCFTIQLLYSPTRMH